MGDPASDQPDVNRLQRFLENNPEASYAIEDESVRISCPWADPTVEFVVYDQDLTLVAALNAIHLPPRFTAIWHLDSKDFEVIAFPMPADNELRLRSFEFRFNGTTFRCEYCDASDRLLLLAECAEFGTSGGETNYRNLRLYKSYLRAKEHEGSGGFREYVPTSFWIRGLTKWDEDTTVQLAQHLNFYMRYFDRQAPQIRVSESLPDQEKKEGPIRYPFGGVPSEISGRPLDPYLLGLWESSLVGNPRLRFLYNYQILEYAAFYYVKDEVRDTIKRAIASPHTNMGLDETVVRILDAITEDRQQEDAKMKAIVQQAVDPLVLWKEIEPNVDFFSRGLQFDGGLRVEPSIKPGWDASDFVTAWHPKFTDQVRKIRNALVHGREQRMANVITPTRANDDKLRPWLGPLSVMAEQVILYRTL